MPRKPYPTMLTRGEMTASGARRLGTTDGKVVYYDAASVDANGVIRGDIFVVKPIGGMITLGDAVVAPSAPAATKPGISDTLESMTVPELAALCGLTKHTVHWWVSGATQDCAQDGWARVKMDALSEDWEVSTTPYARMNLPTGQRITEHAALVALARHLGLTPTPEKTPMPTMKRIERDPKTGEYPADYEPRTGDVLVFPVGPVWAVVVERGSVYLGPKDAEMAHFWSPHVLAHTSHIERPVTTRDVRRPGYVPQKGDRFCGPDGGTLVVVDTDAGNGWTIVDDGTGSPLSERAIGHMAALCTRIERDE